jgi:hypothetical protein
MILIVRVHLCLTCEILFILFYLIEIDLLRTSIEEHMHQVYSAFGERQIRMNIITNGTVTNTSLLAREIDIINRITRCNYQYWSVIWGVFDIIFYIIHTRYRVSSSQCWIRWWFYWGWNTCWINDSSIHKNKALFMSHCWLLFEYQHKHRCHHSADSARLLVLPNTSFSLEYFLPYSTDSMYSEKHPHHNQRW